jgi:hypothetical protein
VLALARPRSAPRPTTDAPVLTLQCREPAGLVIVPAAGPRRTESRLSRGDVISRLSAVMLYPPAECSREPLQESLSPPHAARLDANTRAIRWLFSGSPMLSGVRLEHVSRTDGIDRRF